MFFNGTSNTLRAPGRVVSATSFTVCAWVYLRTPQYNLNVLEVSAVAGGLGPLGLRVDGALDKWTIHCQGFDHVLTDTVQQQWVFVAFVKDGSSVRAIIDETEYATPFTFTGDGPDLFIGREHYGEVVSVKYWEAALTRAELLWEKARSTPFYPTDGYYPLISDVEGLEGTFNPGPTPDSYLLLAYDWLPEVQRPKEILIYEGQDTPIIPLLVELLILHQSAAQSSSTSTASTAANILRLAAANSLSTSSSTLNARRIMQLSASAASSAVAAANVTGRFLLQLASSGVGSLLANLIGRFGLGGQADGTAIATRGVAQVIRTEASEIMLQKQRVHNRLIDVANSGVFYAASINPNTNRMEIDEQKPIKPAKVTVMETISYWQRARFFKRWLSDERAGWTWVMTLTFTNHHAVLERFEELVSDRPINIPADPENGLRSVIVRLVSSEYTHPPEQSPNRGSVVAVTFEATVSRK